MRTICPKRLVSISLLWVFAEIISHTWLSSMSLHIPSTRLDAKTTTQRLLSQALLVNTTQPTIPRRFERLNSKRNYNNDKHILLKVPFDLIFIGDQYSLQSQTTTEDLIPEGVTLRDFDDYSGLRQSVFDTALNGISKRFPQEYGKYRVELHDPHYAEEGDFDLAHQKNALMKNQFLAKRLRGTVKLFNRDTGELVDENTQTLMRVPYITDRGTTIHNGNEYVTLNQARLSSGIYTRKKESGEIESQFNAKRGTGKSYRVRLEPESSLYKLDIDQASLRLYSLLHDIGVSDDELELRWGPEVLALNKAKYDSRTLDKAYAKLVKGGDPQASHEDKVKAIREALIATRVSKKSVERTLPNLFNMAKAASWRKAGFQAQVDSAAQSQDEFVKWDQKRQEQERKAEEQQQKAEAKRDLDAMKETQRKLDQYQPKNWKEFIRNKKNYQRLNEENQACIVEQHKKGNTETVKDLQEALTSSTIAKCMAVDRVTNSTGSRTPGIDGELLETDTAKWEAANTLSKQGYKAQPLRRIELPKPGSNKKRPLGIPTMTDRAMQALYHMALDPIAECEADPNSYGFRKHRSVHDAIEQVRTLLSGENSPEWILDADIEGCFDNIAHNRLLSYLPFASDILWQWLKCGFVDQKANFHPTEKGTPQGGVISPCLCNMTLDGLEKLVKKAGGSGIVRYADDFIVTAKEKSVLEESVKPVIESFLKERGLNLSEAKTTIRHIDEGVDFLGQNVRRINGKIRIVPSEKNISNVLSKTGSILSEPDIRSLESLLAKLNPVIKGWANYHSHVEAKEQYADVDKGIHDMVWYFLQRLHSDKSKEWIKTMYLRKVPNVRGGGTFIVPSLLMETMVEIQPELVKAIPTH